MDAMKTTDASGGGEPTAAQLLGYGYAPGRYIVKCKDCGEQPWDLDKRAIRCKACATVAWRRNREAVALASAPPAPTPDAGSDLATLSAEATQGPWFVDMFPFRDMETGEAQPPQCEGICTHDDVGGLAESLATCGEPEAEFIVALVNAYRSGRLVEASASPPPAEDLAGQGEPVAWAYEEWSGSIEKVWRPKVAARKPHADDGARNIRPLYAAPAPSRPADRGLTEDDLVLLMAREWLNACDGDGSMIESVGEFAMWSPEDHAACQKVAATILARLVPTNPDREGKGGGR